MKNQILYKISDLNFAYSSENSIFENCNFKIENSKTTVITGENGSGKTTLCRLLTGLNQNFEGDIEFQKKSIKLISNRELTNNCIFIKQGSLENVVGTTPLEDLGIWQHKFLEKDLKAIQDLEKAALAQFELQDYCNTPIWEMSSGQTKRIGLSALLLAQKKFWIIDEPVAGLDYKLISKFLKILYKRKRQSRGTLIVSHRYSQFEEIADIHLQIRNKQIFQKQLSIP